MLLLSLHARIERLRQANAAHRGDGQAPAPLCVLSRWNADVLHPALSLTHNFASSQLFYFTDAGKAHLLRKKRPQHLAKLRRVGCVDDAELDTYQRLLLVFPK